MGYAQGNIAKPSIFPKTNVLPIIQLKTPASEVNTSYLHQVLPHGGNPAFREE
jgi:hypothetical protein